VGYCSQPSWLMSVYIAQKYVKDDGFLLVKIRRDFACHPRKKLYCVYVSSSCLVQPKSCVLPTVVAAFSRHFFLHRNSTISTGTELVCHSVDSSISKIYLYYYILYSWNKVGLTKYMWIFITELANSTAKPCPMAPPNRQTVAGGSNRHHSRGLCCLRRK
jgi:hypothetical protein